jgi:CHAT domain-containing protein/Tfp pilus assembly protein PilF
LRSPFGADDPHVATALDNLAVLYSVQAKFRQAEAFLKRALANREKAFNSVHSDVARSLNNLAELYRAEGQYTKAEPILKRSLAIFEQALGLEHPNVATSLNNLAALYGEQGNYVDAAPLYKRSLAIREKALGPDHSDVARSLNDLALAYFAQGQYAEAEALYQRALAILEKSFGPDHRDVGVSLNNQAKLYEAQGRYADAERVYKRSLDVYERSLGRNHPLTAQSLVNLAFLYESRGRYFEAEPLLKDSLAIFEGSLNPDHPYVAQSMNGLAKLYEDEDRYAEALSIVQKLAARNQTVKSIAFDVLYGSQSRDLITPAHGLEASYEVLQRTVSSAAGDAVAKLSARFAATTTELGQLVREDQDLTIEAARLDKDLVADVSKPPTERNVTVEDHVRKRIEAIELERDKLQDLFNQRFPDYVALSKPQPLSVKETQALLADDEALIAIDIDKSSYVWVITTEKAEWKQLRVNVDGINKAVATLRKAFHLRTEGDPSPELPFDTDTAYQLYQRLLGPIEGSLSGKTRLSFILNGALTSLPPHVLIASDRQHRDLRSIDWLARKYAITVLPSIASLKVLRGKSVVVAPKPIIGFGDPVFDKTVQPETKPKLASQNRGLLGFYRGAVADSAALGKALRALSETADELKAVALELGADVDDIKLGEAASVTNVRRAPLYDYRVVYFATHALVAGDVEKFAKVKAEPALVLSIPEKPSEEDDGLLRASDIATLKMNADFVVLSACNTADASDRPGAEALSGLARAFFYAGARSLVVSNWEVESDSTVALMRGLFDALKVTNNRPPVQPRVGRAEVLGTLYGCWGAEEGLTRTV